MAGLGSSGGQRRPGRNSILDHIVRRQILRCLRDAPEPRSTRQLCQELNTAVAPIAYHARVLGQAGYIQVFAAEEAEQGVTIPYFESRVLGKAAVRQVLEKHEEEDDKTLPRQQMA